MFSKTASIKSASTEADIAFAFDCPKCRARHMLRASERGEVRECATCRCSFPAPWFRLPHDAARPPAPSQSYGANCPTCETVLPVSEATAGKQRTCSSCSTRFTQPPPDWARWRRPVARVLSSKDVSRSIHHILRDVTELRYTDLADHDPHLVADFEFYCGSCGGLNTAQRRDIARQSRCTRCYVMLIVPSRGPRLGPSRSLTVGTQKRAEGLYCPRCGTWCADADPHRKARTRCAGCDHVFWSR